jgi:hypothetical protein
MQSKEGFAMGFEIQMLMKHSQFLPYVTPLILIRMYFRQASLFVKIYETTKDREHFGRFVFFNTTIHYRKLILLALQDQNSQETK